MERATLLERLRSGQLLVGTVVTLPDVLLAELSSSLVDLIWIDLEHGAVGNADIGPLAVAARAGRAASLVRLRSFDDPGLGPALDAGVDGIVVPRVDDPSEAAAVVGRLRRPPRGSRGLAARRASAYGLQRDGALPEPVCMIQIESADAVRNAEAIAAVDGVDALVVGCADLATSLGEPAVESSTRLREAVDQVRQAAGTAGIAFGVAGPEDPALLAELSPGGSEMLVLGADVRVYARALEASVERTRVGA